MKPTKAREKLEAWQAEHRQKAEYRLALLEEVGKYREERTQLLPRLKVAMTLTVMLSRETASRQRTKEAVKETIPGLAEIQKRVYELYDDEFRCENRIWRELIKCCFSSQPKTKRPLAIAKHACKLMASVLRVGLPWDGKQMLRELAKKASRQGFPERSINRIENWDLDKPGARIPTSLRKETDAHRDVRKQLEPALAQLRAATGWLDAAEMGDYVTALTCHPALVDFERRWKVLVDLVVHGNGKVEVLNIYDDFFKLGIRRASIEEVRRFFPRYFRHGDRYLLVDRWFRQGRIREMLAAVMDEAKKHDKEPLLLTPPNNKWPNLEADKQIVRLRTGSSPAVYSEIADAIDPALSKEVGRGPGRKRARAPEDSRARREWERLLKRVENRWLETLSKVVQPMED